MNAKNFCKKFADDEIILVGNDIGPFRCFESIGADFPQNEIFIHVQGKELRDYIERTEINFPLTEISALRLLMMIIVRRRRSIFILQSSYVTPLEKILNKLHANIYVIQDFRNDFKFGKAVQYVTAFESIPNSMSNDVSVYILSSLRPKISTSISNTIDANMLLVIGAKELLRFKGCEEFLDQIIEMSEHRQLEVYYKPHPGEDIRIYGSEYFDRKGVSVVSELPIKGFWPKFIVSPHSSLGYDIPESAPLTRKQRFNVLHSFGVSYDSNMQNFPGFEPMISSNSLNFDHSQIQEFFDEKN